MVVDVGGWCCIPCRTLKKAPPRKLTKVAAAAAAVAPPPPIIDEFRSDLDVIKSQIASIATQLAAISPVSSVIVGSKPYADVIREPKPIVNNSINSVSNLANSKQGTSSQGWAPSKHFRSAVLSTVHHEINSINKRSSNVVVTGLNPSQHLSDDLLFKDLCLTHLGCSVDVTKVGRIGRLQDGRVQPLLVSLTNPRDASTLLSIAKQLRSSSDPVVKRQVFINKHLTAAEAKVAYEARVLRRSKHSSGPSIDQSGPSHVLSSPDAPLNNAPLEVIIESHDAIDLSTSNSQHTASS